MEGLQLAGFPIILIYTMRRMQELKISYDKVIKGSYPLPIKKRLLEGILGELQNLERNMAPTLQLQLNSCIKTQTATNFTTNSEQTFSSNILLEQSSCTSPRPVSSLSQQELELKIIEKQRLKCFLNEEIETLEDDYYYLEEILLTKKDLNEEREKAIAKRSFQISKRSSYKSNTPLEQERKGFSTRIRHFFHI